MFFCIIALCLANMDVAEREHNKKHMKMWHGERKNHWKRGYGHGRRFKHRKGKNCKSRCHKHRKWNKHNKWNKNRKNRRCGKKCWKH